MYQRKQVLNKHSDGEARTAQALLCQSKHCTILSGGWMLFPSNFQECFKFVGDPLRFRHFPHCSAGCQKYTGCNFTSLSFKGIACLNPSLTFIRACTTCAAVQRARTRHQAKLKLTQEKEVLRVDLCFPGGGSQLAYGGQIGMGVLCVGCWGQGMGWVSREKLLGIWHVCHKRHLLGRDTAHHQLLKSLELRGRCCSSVFRGVRVRGSCWLPLFWWLKDLSQLERLRCRGSVRTTVLCFTQIQTFRLGSNLCSKPSSSNPLLPLLAEAFCLLRSEFLLGFQFLWKPYFSSSPGIDTSLKWYGPFQAPSEALAPRGSWVYTPLLDKQEDHPGVQLSACWEENAALCWWSDNLLLYI